ncbi:hypothetical protein EJ06DRAFT_533593 [Trichodelitschia bisporula]|uniref:PLAC8-domain-containing protein n=1 Tax=Trichodelitschia bisporula TaxID=703511 RepID=A0A6G1HLZ7_9PEZI|nr:hypothetical protein EJ06DRAFT_533593 [Trichodelitschia bisporula]
MPQEPPLTLNTRRAQLPNPQNRFSWLETPVDMRDASSAPFAPDRTIVESPDTPGADRRRIEGQATVDAGRAEQHEQAWNAAHAEPGGFPVPEREQYPAHAAQQHYPEQAAQQHYPAPVAAQTYPANAAQPQQQPGSPYNFPAPTETHPALYAPVHGQQQQAPISPASPDAYYASHAPQPHPQSAIHSPQSPSFPSPQLTSRASYQPQPLTQPHATLPLHQRASLQPEPRKKSPQPDAAPFSPTSFVPSSPTPLPHAPGQIAHPNMRLSSERQPWSHGLGSCPDASTCLTGAFCPCILDARTAYRLDAKARHRDATDMLGHSDVNGRCVAGVVGGLCGLYWILPLMVRLSVRRVYGIEGGVGGDLVRACCCCWCVVVQSETEVREREERLRMNAGPARGQEGYARVESMVYVPGER